MSRRPEPGWSVPEAVWSAAAADVAAALAVDPARGLAAAEVDRRRRAAGPNLLRQAAVRGAWSVLWDQVRNLITLLLAVSSVLAFVFGDLLDGFAIAAVILINAGIGFATELRAVRSMESLRRLGSTKTRVRRDGSVAEVPAESLVPGDVVVVEGGDVVTADLRLIEASRMEADEAALTGESVPVAKQAERVAVDAVLGDRSSMLHKGTALTRGAGAGVVTATGMATELGRVTALVERAAAQVTPLEQRLDRLGRRLVWASVGFAVLIAAAGWVSGMAPLLVAETAIALAVATVPEGLPIVATLALARGMSRMARRNALIRQLPAVETLGSTSVILTDKTGTLTENRMTVSRIAVTGADLELTGTGLDRSGELRRCDAAAGGRIDDATLALARAALEIGALCNDAALGRTAASGDPMEVALLVAAAKLGLERGELLAAAPEVREEAFDPAVQMMATVHRRRGALVSAVKGAPEAVLARCTRAATPQGSAALHAAGRDAWQRREQAMAAAGLRVLALATGSVERADAPPFADLTLSGLVGLLDPPRGEVRDAIAECRRAGVRVVMATGDHAATAASVARAVGLVDDQGTPPVMTGADLATAPAAALVRAPIVARTSPEQKLDLIEAHQRAGEVVAMIGDGVNDAPALKRADIGIAMGKRGTQVACEAAAMVLGDDDFATIPVAVREGRVIFANLRKFVVYLLSCNLSEILVVGTASAVHAALPLLPLQILFLNLVTDVFPALALAAGEGTAATMARPPRRRGEPVLAARHWRTICAHGVLLAAPVLAAFVIARDVMGLDPIGVLTVSFLTLAFAQLGHLLNLAERGSPQWRNEVTRNRWTWAAVALCTALLLIAVCVPALSGVLHVRPLDSAAWLLVGGASAVPVAVGWAWREWLPVRGRA